MFSLTLVSLLGNHFGKQLKRKKEKSCQQVHCNHKANILEGMSNGKLHDVCQALSSVISTPFFYLHHTKDLRSQRWSVDSLWAVSIWTGDRDIYNAWPCLIIAQRQTTSFLKLCSLLFPNRKARRETGRRWNSDKEFHKEDTVSIILELHHYHFVFLCWCS